MPHSLRARLSGLRYKKIISDKDYERLCKALDNENVLDNIRAEIEASKWTDKDVRIERNALASGLDKALEIIDKYRGESDCRECKAEYDCYECKKYEESEEQA